MSVDPVPDPQPRDDPLAAAVEELRETLAEARRVRADQQSLLDRLHEENTRLRAAMQNRVQDPLVRDLVMLADTCMRTARDWAARTSAEPADVVAALTGVTEDLGLALERQGVETFRPEVGAPFDRHEARAVRSAETDHTALDAMVAEVLRPGYRLGDRVIRPAEVVVWQQAPQPPQAP